MSKRKLPAADIAARPGLRTELQPSALSRWNPEVRAADDKSDASISILDVIGSDFFGEGMTAKRVAGALRAIGERDVTVNINSPGGDYFEGLAIYNLLRDHPAGVTVRILGLAASAAALIAMAGDSVQIARAGFLMIHNTWVIAMGDRIQLREVADWLEPFDTTTVDIFNARTGIEPRELARMLDRETWIGGADAVDQGFADALLPADQVETSASNAETRQVAASHKVDVMLARAGVSRTERRAMLAALKEGTPGAALPGTHDAAALLGDLRDSIRKS
jgi:ATP-dependent Clp protease protease subunit